MLNSGTNGTALFSQLLTTELLAEPQRNLPEPLIVPRFHPGSALVPSLVPMHEIDFIDWFRWFRFLGVPAGQATVEVVRLRSFLALRPAVLNCDN